MIMKVKVNSIDTFIKLYLGLDPKQYCYSAAGFDGELIEKSKADNKTTFEIEFKEGHHNEPLIITKVYQLEDYDDLNWKMKEIKK